MHTHTHTHLHIPFPLCVAIALHEEKDGKENVVEFDFLGKDSIRYYNLVPVEKQVFKNLRLFMENKDPGDDLFDRLTVSYRGDVYCGWGCYIARRLMEC